jgi:hypothetical protein
MHQYFITYSYTTSFQREIKKHCFLESKTLLSGSELETLFESKNPTEGTGMKALIHTVDYLWETSPNRKKARSNAKKT